MLHFPRKQLAEQTVAALRGKVALSDAPNGLFLAAPRRTGKTTFLRLDLLPALDGAGVLPIYVDLWANKDQDPGALIADAIGRAVVSAMGPIAKARQSVKGNVNLGPVSLEINPASVGKADGISVPDALKRLREVAKKPICLIVDEAQHALTSEQGVRAMASLKSARDQMNAPGSVNLMLVMSGSDRDKLLRLVNSNAAPFFGSQISKMPTLGRDFVAHVSKEITDTHAHVKEVDLDGLVESFKLFGYRPQFFITAINDAIAEAATGASFDKAILSHARKAEQQSHEQMTATYCALSPLQRAILWLMFKANDEFRPYDAKALAFYKSKTGKKVTAAQAQQSLERLRDSADPLVWKSARGEYSVEDAGMVRWFESLSQAGKWPPGFKS